MEILEDIDGLEVSGTDEESVRGVDKEKLIRQLGVATKVIGNRHIAYSDLDYLMMFTQDGKLWYQAIGDGHELVLEIGTFEGDGDVTVEYKRLGSVLKLLKDDIKITFGETSVDVSDDSANATLASYQVTGIDLNREGYGKKVATAVKKGHKVNRKDFLETLVYLHGLRARNAEEELMEDIYFTKDYAFVFDVRHVVRLMEKSPIEFALDSPTSETLIAFLSNSDDEYFYLYEKTETEFDIVVGESYYGIKDVNRFIKNVADTLDAFEPEENMTVGLSEFIRYIELATVFLEEDEEDIVCLVEDGEGKIMSDTIDNTSDGTFSAEGVDELEIGMNAKDIITIVGGLRGTVSEKLTFQINLTEEMAYFRHDKGDCLISIYDRQ